MRLIILSLLLLGLAACTTTPDSGTDIEGREVTTVVETPGSQTTGDNTTTIGVYPEGSRPGRGPGRGDPDEQGWADPNAPGGGRIVIYFSHDSNDIAPEYRDAIAKAAQRLARSPQLTAVIEGHCDENGTREYNIALGERRALAVRQLMLLSNINPEQAQVISYGEEKPLAFGHDEESYRQNRRAEISFIQPGGY